MANDSRMQLIIQLKDLASSQLGILENSLKGIGSSVLNLKNAFVGLGAGVALGKITNTFADFDDVMRQVGAVSGATTEELTALTAQAELMGETTRYSAAESADALRLLAMSGLDAAQATAALPGVLQLASSSATDLASSADIATNIMSGLGLSVSDLAQVNDALVATATSSNTTVTELGEAFKNMGALGASSGESVKSLSVVLGVLGNRAIKGGEAGNAVKRMLIQLQNPSAKAAEALNRLNIETKDSEGNFRGLQPILKDLGKAQLDITDSAKIFGLYTANAGVAAANAGADFDILNQKMAQADGTAKRLSTQMEAGLGGALRALNSAWEGLILALGGWSSDALTATVQFFTKEVRGAITVVNEFSSSAELTAWLGTVSTAVRETYENFKTMVSAVTPVLPLLRALIGGLTPEIIALGAAAKVTGTVVGVFAEGWGALSKALAANVFGSTITGAQLLTREIGTLQIALSGVQIAVASIGSALAGLAIGWEIGSFLNQFEVVQKTAQVMFGAIDSAISETKVGFLEIRKAWNDFTGDMKESLAIQEAINTEKAHQDSIKDTIQDIIGKNKAETDSIAIIKETNMAEEERSRLMAESAEKRKEIEFNTNAKITANIIQANKDRLESLKKYTKSAALELEEQKKQLELFAAQGKISAQDVADEKLKLDKEYYSTQLALADDALKKIIESGDTESKEYQKTLELKKTAVAGFNDYQINAAQAASDKLIAIVTNFTKTQGAELAAQKQQIDLQYAEGAISLQDANEKKLGLDKEFYAEQLRLATELFNKLKEEGYSQDSEAFKQAIGLKTAAQRQYTDFMIGEAEAIAKSQAKQTEVVNKGLADIGDKSKEITAEITETKTFTIDEKPAVDAIKKIEAEADVAIVKVEGPYTIEIDADPATAAYERLAAEAQQDMTAIQQVIIELEDSLNVVGQQGSWYITKSLEGQQQQFDEAKAKYDEYMAHIETANKTANDSRVARIQETMMAENESYAASLTAQKEADLAALQSRAETLTAKEQAEIAHYQNLFNLAAQSMSAIKEEYGKDSDAFRQAEQDKNNAYAELVGKQIEIYQNAAEERITTAQEAAEEEIRIEQEKQAELKALADAEYQLARAEAEAKISELEYQADQEIITAQELFEKKKAIEASLLQLKVENSNAALEVALDTYGKDSAEFIKATAAKIRAITELQEKLREEGNFNTKFTGEASPIAPLMQTIQNVKTGISGLAHDISQATPAINIPVSADAGAGAKPFSQAIADAKKQISTISKEKLGGITSLVSERLKIQAPPPPTAQPQKSGNPWGVEDLGKIQLTAGGRSLPVVGQKSAIKEMQKAMVREALTYA
jgi:TP901 family phage tail tape measure protein